MRAIGDEDSVGSADRQALLKEVKACSDPIDKPNDQADDQDRSKYSVSKHFDISFPDSPQMADKSGCASPR